MSRIHDALKKAEEERGRQPLTSLDPKDAKLSATVADSQDEMLPPVIADDIATIIPDSDNGSNQTTVETINARVKRVNWSPNTEKMLFFGKENYDIGTEEFRTLRSRLYGIRDMQPHLRTILITSASPGEGKSFIAANLSQILAQQPNRRVLLIDADLRWSRLHLSLGAPATPGLTEYLAGEANELSVMQRGPLDNMFFIAGGKHASDPAELIANGRLKNLLQQLSPLFDWIIIDSPPAMAVSDPRVMSRMCDGVLLVVAADMGPYEIIQKTRKQFDDKRLLGVVLNRAEPRTSYSYKYYGYYQDPAKNGHGKGRS